MTKKDYIAIARAVQVQMHVTEDTMRQATIGSVAHQLAETFAGDNPRFDRDRFLAACGFGVKGGR
jgi:hypothetical protein